MGGNVALPKCLQNPFYGITLSKFFPGEHAPELSERMGILDPAPTFEETTANSNT